MAVITEAVVRNQIGKFKDKVYTQHKGDILTPSARQFLSDKGIKVVNESTKEKASSTEASQCEEKAVDHNEIISNNPYKFVCYETGAHFISKPEYMTQLVGNQLVLKSHKRIMLRGKIDKILSNSIGLLQQLNKEGKHQVAKDLKEICDWIKAIQRSEILEEPMVSFTFMGLDEATQKAMSHDPVKFFNTPHLFGIDEHTHEIAVRLNVFRTEVREVELAAVEAFYQPKVIERPDLLTAFNRLSSCVYLMMLKAVSGEYDKAPKK